VQEELNATLGKLDSAWDRIHLLEARLEDEERKQEEASEWDAERIRGVERLQGRLGDAQDTIRVLEDKLEDAERHGMEVGERVVRREQAEERGRERLGKAQDKIRVLEDELADAEREQKEMNEWGEEHIKLFEHQWERALKMQDKIQGLEDTVKFQERRREEASARNVDRMIVVERERIAQDKIRELEDELEHEKKARKEAERVMNERDQIVKERGSARVVERSRELERARETEDMQEAKLGWAAFLPAPRARATSAGHDAEHGIMIDDDAPAAESAVHGTPANEASRGRKRRCPEHNADDRKRHCRNERLKASLDGLINAVDRMRRDGESTLDRFGVIARMMGDGA